jgi:hypothetical protein
VYRPTSSDASRDKSKQSKLHLASIVGYVPAETRLGINVVGEQYALISKSGPKGRIRPPRCRNSGSWGGLLLLLLAVSFSGVLEMKTGSCLALGWCCFGAAFRR